MEAQTWQFCMKVYIDLITVTVMLIMQLHEECFSVRKCSSVIKQSAAEITAICRTKTVILFCSYSNTYC